MKTISPSKPTQVQWLTDLHFDRTSPQNQRRFLHRLAASESGIVVISGDISSALHLNRHLLQLAAACAPRPVYFTLGNHDFYGGGLDEVEQRMAQLCRSQTNLHHLDGQKIVTISRSTCLVGFRGWADARAGYGARTVIDSRDRTQIRDFHGLSSNESLRKMRELGADSARMIRRTLPLALSRFRHVVVLSHVPPFPESVIYDGKPCAPTHLPHFCNLSAGLAIRAITSAYPQRRVTVLSGHSHSSSVTQILPNLTAIVGHARPGKPDLLDILKFP
jgi:predicted MPP superfamily phosphohydrolase